MNFRQVSMSGNKAKSLLQEAYGEYFVSVGVGKATNIKGKKLFKEVEKCLFTNTNAKNVAKNLSCSKGWVPLTKE
jgi:hypothetical protein